MARETALLGVYVSEGRGWVWERTGCCGGWDGPPAGGETVLFGVYMLERSGWVREPVGLYGVWGGTLTRREVVLLGVHMPERRGWVREPAGRCGSCDGPGVGGEVRPLAWMSDSCGRRGGERPRPCVDGAGGEVLPWT